MVDLRPLLLALVAALALVEGQGGPPKPVSDAAAELTRAKAARKAAQDGLEAADKAAPAGGNPWEATQQSQATMQRKSTAQKVFDQATAAERTAAETAEEAQAKVPFEQTSTGRVKEELRPALEMRPYQPVPFVVNVQAPDDKECPDCKPAAAAPPGGSFASELASASQGEAEQPRLAAAGDSDAKQAAKFNYELKVATGEEEKMDQPDQSSASAAGSLSPSSSTAYMEGYDKTMEELKFKRTKRLAMQKSYEQAVNLKAEAMAAEKRTQLQVAQQKVKYEDAKVAQAKVAVRDAQNAENSGELAPKVGAELVIEEEGHLKHATKDRNQAIQKEKNVEELESEAKQQLTGKDVQQQVKDKLKKQKEYKAMAKAAYEKHVAMRYVRDKFEQRRKQRIADKLKVAERHRKGKRSYELGLKRSAAKESEGKSLENKQKGIEQARLKEGSGTKTVISDECKVSAWGAYGLCSKKCGGGMKVSTRKVISKVRLDDLCPALARGKMCNSHPCTSGGSSQLMGESLESKSGEACHQARTKCTNFQRVLSQCEAHVEKKQHQPHDSHAKAVQEIGEEWHQSPLEAAEIRSAVAHLHPTSAQGRQLLSLEPSKHCQTIREAVQKYCRKSQDCHGTSGAEVGEGAPKASQNQPHDEEFDKTLIHLVDGPLSRLN